MNASLHTLNASSREHRALFERLLRCASAGDSVLLIENGVYSLTEATFLSALSDAGLTLYVLQADIAARGLQQYINTDVTMVDDAGFVALVCEHRKTVSWFA
jgi:tRNA 2-thiouridine synthesizing protein B